MMILSLKTLERTLSLRTLERTLYMTKDPILDTVTEESEEDPITNDPKRGHIKLKTLRRILRRTN